MSELREKVHVWIVAGNWPADIACRFDVFRGMVYRVKKLHGETGGFDWRPSTGRPGSTCTMALVDKVKSKIEENPQENICKIAKDLKVDKSAMSRIMRKDLGMKSRPVTKFQGLTAKQREKRLERCKVLLNKLKNGKDKILVFSNEKKWTVDAVSNSRSTRYIAKRPTDVPPSVRFMGRTKHPASCMMLGYIRSDGKAFPPVPIQGTLGTANYKRVLAHKVFPTLDATYGPGGWTWIQDGASCQTSKKTQAYILQCVGSGGFWSKVLWPPNFPNLNPLDFHIWSTAERVACAHHHSSVANLEKSVEEHWAKMSAAKLKVICAKFRPHLERCIAAEGEIFEK